MWNWNKPVILRCRFSRIRGLFRRIREPLEPLAFEQDFIQLLFVVLSLQLVSQLGRDATECSTEIDADKQWKYCTNEYNSYLKKSKNKNDLLLDLETGKIFKKLRWNDHQLIEMHSSTHHYSMVLIVRRCWYLCNAPQPIRSLPMYWRAISMSMASSLSHTAYCYPLLRMNPRRMMTAMCDRRQHPQTIDRAHCFWWNDLIVRPIRRTDRGMNRGACDVASSMAYDLDRLGVCAPHGIEHTSRVFH